MTSRHPSVELAGGVRVNLRAIGPDDEHHVRRFFQGLDPESRRLRFHQPVPVVKPWLVRPLVDVDQVHHVAWSVWADREMVGEARYVVLRDVGDTAEVAFSVADHLRRRGVGRLMVEALGVLARVSGIEWFTSTVGHDNRASSALLTSLGTRFTFGDGALEGRGPVPPWSGSAELARWIRAHHTDLVSATPAVGVAA